MTNIEKCIEILAREKFKFNLFPLQLELIKRVLLNQKGDLPAPRFSGKSTGIAFAALFYSTIVGGNSLIVSSNVVKNREWYVKNLPIDYIKQVSNTNYGFKILLNSGAVLYFCDTDKIEFSRGFRIGQTLVDDASYIRNVLDINIDLQLSLAQLNPNVIYVG